jgi:hypothetical protein
MIVSVLSQGLIPDAQVRAMFKTGPHRLARLRGAHAELPQVPCAVSRAGRQRYAGDTTASSGRRSLPTCGRFRASTVSRVPIKISGSS